MDLYQPATTIIAKHNKQLQFCAVLQVCHVNCYKTFKETRKQEGDKKERKKKKTELKKTEVVFPANKSKEKIRKNPGKKQNGKEEYRLLLNKQFKKRRQQKKKV